MDIESTSANVIVEWTQESEPTTNQVWRSVNGGAFALIASVAGTVTTYADTTGMGVNDVWCYKVRGVTGSTPGEFSNEGCAVNQYTGTEGGDVSHPTWMLAFGDFVPADASTVTSLNLSGMLSVSGAYLGDGTQVMTMLNLDSLIQVGESMFLDGSVLLTEVNLRSLERVTSDFHIDNGNAITALRLDSLTDIGDDMFCDGCPDLTTVFMPVFVFESGIYAFDSDALSAASIEHILAVAVASAATTATIQLDGGTSATLSALSGQGQANYAALVLDGNTLSINT